MSDKLVTKVAEKPILFSGAMVRAILESKKTQTRRVAKEFNPRLQYRLRQSDGEIEVLDAGNMWGIMARRTVCPYGKPGDRLWVRESIQKRGWDTRGNWDTCFIRYLATDECLSVPTPDPVWVEHRMQSKVPSIYMPRWASRLTLGIVSVEVERLQEISEEDAKAEGVQPVTGDGCAHYGAFRELWDSINAKRGFGWDKNPWVWVVEFKRYAEGL